MRRALFRCLIWLRSGDCKRPSFSSSSKHRVSLCAPNESICIFYVSALSYLGFSSSFTVTCYMKCLTKVTAPNWSKLSELNDKIRCLWLPFYNDTRKHFLIWRSYFQGSIIWLCLPELLHCWKINAFYEVTTPWLKFNLIWIQKQLGFCIQILNK